MFQKILTRQTFPGKILKWVNSNDHFYFFAVPTMTHCWRFLKVVKQCCSGVCCARCRQEPFHFEVMCSERFPRAWSWIYDFALKTGLWALVDIFLQMWLKQDELSSKSKMVGWLLWASVVGVISISHCPVFVDTILFVELLSLQVWKVEVYPSHCKD